MLNGLHHRLNEYWLAVKSFILAAVYQRSNEEANGPPKIAWVVPPTSFPGSLILTPRRYDEGPWERGWGRTTVYANVGPLATVIMCIIMCNIMHYHR